MNDLGLYVHVPFCQSKCGYCDFYSVVCDPEQASRVLDAMLMELEHTCRKYSLPVSTVFIGGGTPTVLPDHDLDRLLAGVMRHCRGPSGREFTVEANPACITAAKAQILRNRGVNRISLGGQSFNADELALLGRRHGPEDIGSTIHLVRQAGFERINLDLIFGVPGQDMVSWRDSLRRAVDLGVNHLSCYGLTYEAGTPLHTAMEAGEVAPVGEELEAEMYLAACDYLADQGLHQYEISNFAAPGTECRHNLRYWYGEPTLAVGPAAAAYVDGCRWRNVANVGQYVSRILAGREPVEESETLLPRARAGEMAMLRLRLTDGIDCSRFRQDTGYDVREVLADALDRHLADGLIEKEADRIRLTRRGRLLANSVMADCLQTDGMHHPVPPRKSC